MSGIWRAEIPMINGSNTLIERFSGSFRQHDTGTVRLRFAWLVVDVPG